jgi:hypothetical protein
VGNYWDAVVLCGLGVLTGAVLCGWRPPGYERWQRWQAERRALQQEREQEFKAQQLIRDIHKRAEQISRERVKRGLPAKVTYAEWEEFLATRRLEYVCPGRMNLIPKHDDERGSSGPLVTALIAPWNSTIAHRVGRRRRNARAHRSKKARRYD